MSNCLKCGVEVDTGATMCMSCAGKQEFVETPAVKVCSRCATNYYVADGCVCQNDLKRVEENYHRAKEDLGKPKMFIMLSGFVAGLALVAKVTNFGLKKYGKNTWQTVPDAEERYHDALVRHLLAIGDDEESGLPHMAHVAWNALALLSLGKK